MSDQEHGQFEIVDGEQVGEFERVDAEPGVKKAGLRRPRRPGLKSSAKRRTAPTPTPAAREVRPARVVLALLVGVIGLGGALAKGYAKAERRLEETRAKKRANAELQWMREDDEPVALRVADRAPESGQVILLE